MHVNFQFKIFVYLYAVLWIAQIALIFNAYLSYRIKVSKDNWANHSVEVKKTIADANKAYSEADNKGRINLISGQKEGLTKIRQLALDKISETIEKVKDNETQVETAQNLLLKVKERFAIQDRQSESALVQDGKIQTNTGLGYVNLNSQIAVNNAFNELNAEEDRVLISRFESAFTNLHQIGLILVAIILINICVGVGGFIWNWRLIQHILKVASDIRKNSGQIVTDEKLELFAEYIEGQIDRLPKL